MLKLPFLHANFAIQKSVESFAKTHKLPSYTIEQGLVNFLGHVNLSGQKLQDLPFAIGRVKGDFIVKNNQLTSFHHFPLWVEGRVNCANNQITSLEYCPKIIQGNFSCENNPIETIELSHLPEQVDGMLIFYHPENKEFEYFHSYYKDYTRMTISCFGNEKSSERIHELKISLDMLKKITSSIEQERHLSEHLGSRVAVKRKKI